MPDALTTLQYRRGLPPGDPASFQSYVNGELRKIDQATAKLADAVASIGAGGSGAGAMPEPQFHTSAYQNGWKDLDAQNWTCPVTKIAGIVLVNDRLVPGTANVPSFTLPEGFRPYRTLFFNVTRTAGGVPYYILVYPNGDVIPYYTDGEDAVVFNFSFVAAELFPA